MGLGVYIKKDVVIKEESMRGNAQMDILTGENAKHHAPLQRKKIRGKLGEKNLSSSNMGKEQ